MKVIKKYILNKITIIFIITLCIIFFTAKTFNNAFKEFEEVVFSAPLNEIQGPVKTQFGYHLIEVTSRND